MVANNKQLRIQSRRLIKIDPYVGPYKMSQIDLPDLSDQ